MTEHNYVIMFSKCQCIYTPTDKPGLDALFASSSASSSLILCFVHCMIIEHVICILNEMIVLHYQ